jgi:phosphocarrier protein HPr
MQSAQMTVETGVGLHARPAALLVGEARKYPCRLTVEHNGNVADAKSILQILGLGVRDHETVTIRADGDGEETALSALHELFLHRFRPRDGA